MTEVSNLNPELLDRADELADKLAAIENSQGYTSAMVAMAQFQKDNFEMIDRSLSMMQAVHRAELQNNSFYVDIIKLLTPIFATAAIAGASLDTPGINSLALIIAGGVGLVVSVVILVPLLVQHHKKARRQSAEYTKLSEAFKKWEKVADLRKQLESNPDFNIENAESLFGEIFEFANMTKEVKNE